VYLCEVGTWGCRSHSSHYWTYPSPYRRHTRSFTSTFVWFIVCPNLLTFVKLSLVWETRYDRYRGVISLLNIKNGSIHEGLFGLYELTKLWLQIGDKITSCSTRKRYEVTEVGIMHPEEVPTGVLHAGQVGYIACNMKQPSEGNLHSKYFTSS
jgi:hypothetical protein